MQRNTKTYYAELRRKLKEKGFDTSRTQTYDGMLRVWDGIRMLDDIGPQGEFYCNSNDLADPHRKAQIETVMQCIEEVNRS